MIRQWMRCTGILKILLLNGGMLSCVSDLGAADTRLVYSGHTHTWLRAVGKLQVPGQRYNDGQLSHYVEDCSATLVALPHSQQSDTIVSAWHCLENYRDVSKPITFTLWDAFGKTVQREVYRLEDGGGMHADWAILRLREPVTALQVVALPILNAAADPYRPVIMAGYSRDTGIGAAGEVLTYDPDCTITQQDHNLGDTDCTAFKGASGGAVIQLSSAGEAFVCGVISQGNGEDRSTYVPLSGFRHSINRHL
ncbi:MAG: trypsin-like peptidase domain-containing protein [Halioglobus sp.]